MGKPIRVYQTYVLCLGTNYSESGLQGVIMHNA